ncbi:MAG: prepilin-type N-terminal cleavage/methylation domain-containing protein [bacterium]
MKPTKNKKGVTLLELLITMSIMSIIFLIGFTSFNSVIENENVNCGVQQMVYAIKQARHYSRINGINTEFDANAGDNSYQIKSGTTILTNEKIFDSSSGKLPTDVEIINNTCPKIYFYVDGTPVNSTGVSLSSDCIIKVGYMHGLQKTLTLEAVSGNIIYDK